MKKQKGLEVLKTVIKIIFAGGLIAWLLTSGRLDMNEVHRLLFSPFVALLAFTLLLGFILATYRWHILLRSQNINRPFLETLKLNLIGTFFNLLVPGGVGGDVVKAYYVAHHNPEQKMRAILTIFMDRFLGLFTMVFMAFFVMIVEWQRISNISELRVLFYFLAFINLAFCIFWAVIFSNRLSQAAIIRKTIRIKITRIVPSKRALSTLLNPERMKFS